MFASTDSAFLQRILRMDAPASGMFSGIGGERDEDLLKEFQEGTQKQRHRAFTVLYRRYHPDVWRYILKLVRGHQERAKDISANVWICGFEKLDTFKWKKERNRKTSPLLCWLWEIADRKALEEWRSEKETIEIDPVKHILTTVTLDSLSSPQHVPPEVQKIVDSLLHEALNELNATDRKIINLIYYLGKNSTEIGVILKMEPGTVRVRHHRAIRQLRAFFTQNGYPHDAK